MASQALIGRIGTVIAAVRGAAGPGEVRLKVGGLAHYYLAYAPVPIPVGTQVLVLHYRGHRAVDVEPWPASPTDTFDVRPSTTEGY